MAGLIKEHTCPCRHVAWHTDGSEVIEASRDSRKDQVESRRTEVPLGADIQTFQEFGKILMSNCGSYRCVNKHGVGRSRDKEVL